MPTTAPDLPTLDRVTLDETIGTADRPVLVDIWGPGCPACSALAATLETMASLRDDLDIYQINESDAPDLAVRYGVRAVPTLLVFEHGELRGVLVGARGPRRLAKELEDLLNTRS